MLEHSPERFEIDAIRLIEVEIFVAGAYKDPSLAECFGPICQHGPEAGCFLHDTVGKDEPGHRGGEGHLAELDADLCVDGTEAVDARSLEVNLVKPCGRE